MISDCRPQQFAILTTMKTALTLLAFLPLALPAQEPASLKSAFGKWFETGVALPGGTISEAEAALIRANFTNMTPEFTTTTASNNPPSATRRCGSSAT